MRVKITKILPGDGKCIDIEFVTDYGHCRASWVGIEPIVGHDYEIEIEIPDKLTWQYNILISPHKIFQLKINENTVSLIGILASIDENCSSLKVGNTIILLEAECMPLREGTFVEVLAENIAIYDINI